MSTRSGADVETLKVSARSNPNSVAGAMAGVVRQSGGVVVQVIGAGALNQAVKAVAIARGFVAASGMDLVCVPSFADVEIEGERRTAIRLCIEDRLRRKAVPSGEEQPPSADVDLTERPVPAPGPSSAHPQKGTEGFHLP
jgi:stage V sporulation protein S